MSRSCEKSPATHPISGVCSTTRPPSADSFTPYHGEAPPRSNVLERGGEERWPTRREFLEATAVPGPLERAGAGRPWYGVHVGTRQAAPGNSVRLTIAPTSIKAHHGPHRVSLLTGDEGRQCRCQKTKGAGPHARLGFRYFLKTALWCLVKPFVAPLQRS